ncbi:MAG: hypothetical protein AAGK93_07920, partial [Pseudomonadota bacterium]
SEKAQQCDQYLKDEYTWLKHRHDYNDLPHWSDGYVANAVRMLMRDQLNHELVCTAGANRISKLAIENAKLSEQIVVERDAHQSAMERSFDLINLDEICQFIIQDVAELPDRTSPDEWPDAMIVTGAELEQIIINAMENFAARPAMEETESLRAQIAALKAALTPFAAEAENLPDSKVVVLYLNTDDLHRAKTLLERDKDNA